MNEVTILVRAIDQTKAGFESAGGGASKLMGFMGGLAIAGTAALAGIAVEAVKMGAQFDSVTMRMVTQAGLPMGQLGQMRNGILKLAGSVGFDPNSLAESAYHVASAMSGMGATSQQMLNVVKIAAEGAKVGGADLVAVTNALTAAVVSGIPGVQNYSQAMGALNAIVGSGDMQMQDLASSLGTGLLAVMKGYGLTLTQVGAALAVFGDNNLRGAGAATSLRVAVQSISSPMKAGQAELAKLGLSAKQLQSDLASGGLTKALDDIKTHLTAAGITADQQGQIITEIFGKKAGTGINVLLGQLDRYHAKLGEITKGASGFGQAWSDTQATLSQVWDRIKSGFDAMMVKVGEILSPKIMKAIDEFSKMWDKLSPMLEKIVKQFGFDKDLKNIEKDFGKIGDAVKQNWPQIKELIGLVGAVILVVIKIVLTLIDWVLKLDAQMIRVWARAIDAVNGFVKFAVNNFGVFLHAADKAFNWIPGIGGMLDSATKDFDKFKDKVNAAIDGITSNKDVNITAHYAVVSANAINAAHGGHGFQAHGGVVGAASGRTLSSGLTWVGEQGAELLDLPAGTTVHSNPDSMRMASQGSGGGGTADASVRFDGNLDSAMANAFKYLFYQGKIKLTVNGVVARIA